VKHATLRLRPYVLVTYAVPPARLRGRLPPALQLRTVDFGDGTAQALLSMFAGRVEWVRAFGWPFPEGLVQYEQVNIRTYVTHREQEGIFFFRSFVGSRPVAAAARFFSGFPARHEIIRLDVQMGRRPPSIDRCYLRVGEHIELEVGEAEATGLLEGFSSSAEALHFLADPPVGFYVGLGGNLKAIAATHKPLSPLAGQMVRAHLPWLVNQGLLEPSEVGRPHSILMAEGADFEILLGPHHQ
jgi:hypothetical protein